MQKTLDQGTGPGFSALTTEEVISMAGRGPAPKDPRRRARRGNSEIDPTIIEFEKAPQPELSAEWDWPDETLEWWSMWAQSPLSEHFMATDWSFLHDTAMLHARYWQGDISVAGELRVRVAKFGATPEDRARLRIQFADADHADGGQRSAGQSARERRRGSHAVGLEVVGGASAVGE